MKKICRMNVCKGKRSYRTIVASGNSPSAEMNESGREGAYLFGPRAQPSRSPTCRSNWTWALSNSKVEFRYAV